MVSGHGRLLMNNENLGPINMIPSIVKSDKRTQHARWDSEKDLETLALIEPSRVRSARGVVGVNEAI